MSIKKKIIITTVIAIIIIIGLYIYYLISNNNNKTKNNITDNIIYLSENNEVYYSELLISNIKYNANNGKTHISGKITNNTNSDIRVDMFDVILLDNNDNEIGFIDFYQGGNIKSGNTIDINFEVDYEYKGVYALKFDKHRILELNNESVSTDENLTKTSITDNESSTVLSNE